MGNMTSTILLGASHFASLAGLLTVPFILMQVVRRRWNLVRLAGDYVFLFYVLCVIALVFFPLPTLAESAKLSRYDIQYVPFRFVSDIIRETPFVWNRTSTYIPALTNRAVLQVVYNILMFVPFGIYMRYMHHCSGKKILLLSFAVSLFIELAQLTGLFFLFSGSYRLCDVDDLLLNTLGGVIGYTIVRRMEKHILPIEAFDRKARRHARGLSFHF